METRRKDFSASADARVGGQDSQVIPLDQPIVLDDSLKDEPMQALLMQQVGTGATSFAELLPLQVPLRPRKSRRCRAELAEGRPGILLKPKLNPLEGDSSLRTGHGQWWKKVGNGNFPWRKICVVAICFSNSSSVASIILCCIR